MKYLVTNAINAVKIHKVESVRHNSGPKFCIYLEGGDHITVDPPQFFASNPVPGDYWVTHSDGSSGAVSEKYFLKAVDTEPLRELIIKFLDGWNPEEFQDVSLGRTNHMALGLIKYLRDNK